MEGKVSIPLWFNSNSNKKNIKLSYDFFSLNSTMVQFK